MEEIELDNQVEVDDYHEDRSYHACYIFRSTKHKRTATEQPSKRRKLNGHTRTSPQIPRIDEKADNASLAQQRHLLFTNLWRDNESRLSLDNVDDEKLTNLVSLLNNHFEVPVADRLCTALLLTGPDDSNYGAVLDLLSAKLEAAGRKVVVELHSRQCPNVQLALKNIIRGAIVDHAGLGAYVDFMAKHKKTVPLPFDLELLEKYVSNHSITKVVVSVSDIETFDGQTTSEIITTLRAWQSRIPFILVLGITSTRHLFETRLSKACLKQLAAQDFDFAPRTDASSELLRRLQLWRKDSDQVYLDPKLVAVLQDMSQVQGQTARGMLKAIKYVNLTHFLANPVSLLAGGDVDSLDSNQKASLAKAIRCTGSFQMKCEALLATNTKAAVAEVRALLKHDSILLSRVKQEVSMGQKMYRQSCQAIMYIADLYCALAEVDINLKKSRFDIEAEIYQTMHDLADCAAFDDIENCLMSMTPQRLLAVLHELDAATTDGLGIRDSINAMETQQEDSIDPALASSHGIVNLSADIDGADGNNLISSTPKAKRRKNTKANSLGSKLATTTNGVHSADAYDLVGALKRTLQRSSLEVDSLLLHEAYIISASSVRFKQNFDCQSRSATERALLKPGDYFGCECCTSTAGDTEDDIDTPHVNDIGAIIGPMPPASILFTLLQEAPTTINVRDLFDAFRSRFEQAKRGEDIDLEDEDNVKVSMTQFYRALAELKMVGLVKASTSTQIKKRTSGKNAKSLTQDVDFVAKTSWAGL